MLAIWKKYLKTKNPECKFRIFVVFNVFNNVFIYYAWAKLVNYNTKIKTSQIAEPIP